MAGRHNAEGIGIEKMARRRLSMYIIAHLRAFKMAGIVRIYNEPRGVPACGHGGIKNVAMHGASDDAPARMSAHQKTEMRSRRARVAGYVVLRRR